MSQTLRMKGRMNEHSANLVFCCRSRNSKKYKCSICGQFGHNQTNCPMRRKEKNRIEKEKFINKSFYFFIYLHCILVYSSCSFNTYLKSSQIIIFKVFDIIQKMNFFAFHKKSCPLSFLGLIIMIDPN